MLRRNLLAGPLLLAAPCARADWVPRQPIHVIVGFAPDVYERVFSAA